MNANIENRQAALLEEWGERLSAYVDNELTERERTEVEALIASNPQARRLADDFRGVQTLCRSDEPPVFKNDLASGVLAEALRQQANGSGAGESNLEVRPLEPEGDFGLPFGKTSRGWMWAGVAAAAALVIGIYGREPARGPIVPIDQGVAAMQQAVPGLQVVNLEATPEQWRRVYQQQLKPAARRELPVALASAKRRGLKLEAGMPARDAAEQLLYLPGGMKQVENLRGALDGTLHQVGPDGGAVAPPAPAAQSQLVPVTRIIIRGKPGQSVRLAAPAPNGGSPTIQSAPGDRPIVLRVRVRAR